MSLFILFKYFFLSIQKVYAEILGKLSEALNFTKLFSRIAVLVPKHMMQLNELVKSIGEISRK